MDCFFEELVKIMSELRGKDGCPWDKEQTHQTLRNYTIEEAYEVVDAIEEDNFDHLKEELGDLLLQIVFHSQIASENNKFTIEDVLKGLILKLKRRHPHIFGDFVASSSEEVVMNWEKIKKEEKGEKSLFEDIPLHLPSSLFAYLVQSKASKVGFDWTEKAEVISKIEEEIEELKDSLNGNGILEEEIGDIFFSLVNLSRHLKIDPEISLRRTTRKFIKRFEYMEKKAEESGKTLEELSLDEKEKLWIQAKNET
ncbi:MAG: nucleoside triphosphate pyrophosphohydrolase [Actinobacteria bacterium]|nr:nucleoside triphosphate pyrophosphohydrolase [Actinomycetota bacterium]